MERDAGVPSHLGNDVFVPVGRVEVVVRCICATIWIVMDCCMTMVCIRACMDGLGGGGCWFIENKTLG